MARPKKNKSPDTTSVSSVDAFIEEMNAFYDQYLSTESDRVTRVGSYGGLLSLGIESMAREPVTHRVIVPIALHNTDELTRLEAEHALVAFGYKILNGW